MPEQNDVYFFLRTECTSDFFKAILGLKSSDYLVLFCIFEEDKMKM